MVGMVGAGRAYGLPFSGQSHEILPEGKPMKILIATDGSKFSQAAVEKACELITDPNETEIKIVSVFSVPTIATEPFMPAPDYYGEMTRSGRVARRGLCEYCAGDNREPTSEHRSYGSGSYGASRTDDRRDRRRVEARHDSGGLAWPRLLGASFAWFCVGCGGASRAVFRAGGTNCLTGKAGIAPAE